VRLSVRIDGNSFARRGRRVQISGGKGVSLKVGNSVTETTALKAEFLQSRQEALPRGDQ
jgi:hypothetical protein